MGSHARECSQIRLPMRLRRERKAGYCGYVEPLVPVFQNSRTSPDAVSWVGILNALEDSPRLSKALHSSAGLALQGSPAPSTPPKGSRGRFRTRNAAMQERRFRTRDAAMQDLRFRTRDAAMQEPQIQNAGRCTAAPHIPKSDSVAGWMHKRNAERVRAAKRTKTL